ncbi:MAG: acetyl-CoA C-acyltransferase [Bdellovibrio sp.]|nr:acetyl-CoA C-acyltransferase [Bdellovibrio sp.]
MAQQGTHLVILGGKRTPFGANGGVFKDVSPTELCTVAAKAALEQSGIDGEQIDHVIVGNVLHSAPESIYIPRHVGLKVGIPEHVPSLGINRLCGSGFQVIVEAYQQMTAGDSKIALVGGVENMSMSPYLMRSVRWGNKMGNLPLTDMMMEVFFDAYAQLPMGLTAERLGDQYKITREQADRFALRSQNQFEAAASQGKFQKEIAAFKSVDKKGNAVLIDQDEHPKFGTTYEKLAKLKSVFKPDGLVTAGTASGIVDGAAMMVVSTEAEAKSRKLRPLARMVSYGIAGCDPKIMGIGPVPAIQQALKKAKMKLDQMDLIEVNEAFAAQTLAVSRELSFPEEKLNINGGAIAVGHPLAASGTRIIQTLIYELERQKKRYGIGAACIGGGQGIAIIIESLLF